MIHGRRRFASMVTTTSVRLLRFRLADRACQRDRIIRREPQHQRVYLFRIPG